jgi:hypothetical protein
VLLRLLLDRVGLRARDAAGGHVGVELVRQRALEGSRELLGRDVEALGNVVQEGLTVAGAAATDRVRAAGTCQKRQTSGATGELSFEPRIHAPVSTAVSSETAERSLRVR